ncbi:hypothetical protein BC834DRAFT_57972 [Gloeopeniophorella convolvens]|nr:hypothetical protein BC834DRAFT_57972 [Gloeopeniophorella convolvens]
MRFCRRFSFFFFCAGDCESDIDSPFLCCCAMSAHLESPARNISTCMWRAPRSTVDWNARRHTSCAGQPEGPDLSLQAFIEPLYAPLPPSGSPLEC